ncbi:GNAT family N-acetyltransferase [Desulfolucanica intricata]|uniref:GNAT family N-acetyltransferase n=1 Tax=Desulfolucanica intricata TaxID=1285191 RepID=UPI00082F24CD|nr:GNAT family N-acetyltransferase [Desulfolucanica intricata]
MFEVISPQETGKWQEALKRVEGLDLHYQLEYCRLFAETGIPELFLYREGDRYVVYPYIKRPINQIPGINNKLKGELYDITTPYGFGGPAASPEGDEKFRDDFYRCFSQYCRENKIITEFIRFHPLLENHRLWDKQVSLTRVSSNVYVDLTLSEEDLWANYEYNNRKNIKKACREGLEVLLEEEPKHFEEFLTIYYHTMDRNKAGRFYYFPREFYEKLHRDLKGSFLYAHTLKDGKIVSTELLLFNKQYIHSFLGGTLKDYYSYHPNNILKHEVIKWARAKGIKYFILGGGYKDGDGIFRYKRSFSRNGVVDFYVGKKIYDPETVQWLELLRASSKRTQDENYFPPYRR